MLRTISHLSRRWRNAAVGAEEFKSSISYELSCVCPVSEEHSGFVYYSSQSSAYFSAVWECHDCTTCLHVTFLHTSFSLVPAWAWKPQQGKRFSFCINRRRKVRTKCDRVRWYMNVISSGVAWRSRDTLATLKLTNFQYHHSPKCFILLIPLQFAQDYSFKWLINSVILLSLCYLYYCGTSAKQVRSWYHLCYKKDKQLFQNL